MMCTLMCCCKNDMLLGCSDSIDARLVDKSEQRSFLQGAAADEAVRCVAQAVAVAWGHALLPVNTTDAQNTFSSSTAADEAAGGTLERSNSVERARALFAASSNTDDLLAAAAAAGAGSRRPQTVSRVKNLDMLFKRDV